jgi:hypothetical protein
LTSLQAESCFEIKVSAFSFREKEVCGLILKLFRDRRIRSNNFALLKEDILNLLRKYVVYREHYLIHKNPMRALGDWCVIKNSVPCKTSITLSTYVPMYIQNFSIHKQLLDIFRSIESKAFPRTYFETVVDSKPNDSDLVDPQPFTGTLKETWPSG